MTREEFVRLREEMSRVFAVNTHRGVDVASEISMISLFNTLMQKLVDAVAVIPGKQVCCDPDQPECCGDPEHWTMTDDILEAIQAGMIRDASGGLSFLPSAGVPPIVRTHPSDGRPVGWTEAMCLEYIAEESIDDPDLLACYFVQGDWHELHKTFPEFARWMNDRVKQ